VSAVIETRELGRWYGQVVGLNELSTTIEGGITGLVGPNGAGKSTLLKLIVGEIRPSRGSIRVLGQAPFANRALYRRLGFSPQQDALYDAMTGREMVRFLMRLAGFGRREAERRARAALERVRLDKAMDRPVRTYSKGMRQRVRVAQAIAHEPELLVLDEPLTGLDPIGRRDLLELLRELGRAGTHVLISSHVLHEVEDLTHEILLVHRGRLLAKGDIREVRALLGQHPRRVELVARRPRELAGALVRFEEVVSVRLDGADGRVAVETRSPERFFERLTPLAAQGAFGLSGLESVDASLEAVFDYLVG
jgi:ABC-2 type transport system ATP-binding protein